ncbi:hypothetical protein KC969_12780 [Proteus mirabilis]|nr:hypothetical protein [Proteus mirabilis]ELI8995207.1 hypothetical protein [Proteus mirabilis]EMF0768124.1 hypothetical protein [Proteus mirabilis]RQW36351.1 hypothetical protein EHQ84_09555 [Proteus mirabilis]HAT6279300.1 hypothetical protein [Proteus mirabilis]
MALPERIPIARWVYEQLRRLSGWKDNKRNGRASVKTLRESWFKLQAMLEGYESANFFELDL